MRPSRLWAVAAIALGATLAACSGGPKLSTVPTAGSPRTTTTVSAGGTGSSGQTPLAEAEAYSQCMRGHGAPNFPDPVLTPSGAYGYRTTGIDPHSAAFQGALQACKSLPSPWHSTGQQLSPAQQQAWLSWAECIRAHGVPNLPDPTFSGRTVQISGVGGSRSPQLQSAMEHPHGREQQGARQHDEAGVAEGELEAGAQARGSIHGLLLHCRCPVQCRCGSRRRPRWR